MSATKLTAIGYWNEPEEYPHLPHPSALVDAEWAHDERAKLVGYLKTGARLHEWLGFSHCRFANGPPNKEMGNADLTDGVWLWPEGLWIYVERYFVRLPDEFLVHARANRFRVPEKLDVAALSDLPEDEAFWAAWCEQNGRPSEE